MDDHLHVFEQVSRAINKHDAEAVARMYTEKATYMLPGEQEPLRGRKAIQASYETFFKAFPDFKVELSLTMSSGEHFLGEGTFGGTHTGPLETPQGDIPPTGRKVEIRCAFILNVTPDGLIADDRSYFDSASLMSQLGLT